MTAYVRSANVDLAQNSKFVEVNDSANIGNIKDGWGIFINERLVGIARTVNTGANPPTIELHENYTGNAIVGGALYAVITQGAISAIGDRLTSLADTYEGIADSVATTATPNSLVKRTSDGRVKVANGTDSNDAVAYGQFTNQSAAILDGDRRAVERASGGKLTVLYDDLGNPSLHHIIPKFRYEDLGFDTQLGTGVATAFLVNGVEKSEIFVGAHLGSMVNGRLCSIPRVDPAASMDWDTFKAACEAKGPGWHMMTGHEWAAVAFWCAANGYQPRGNTNYGRAHDRTLEMGIRQDGGIAGDASGMARTLTGSGPNQWAHNADPNGIFDLVGNVWEWNDCYKIIDGRIFAAPDNDWTLAEASWTDTGVDIDAANPWTSSAVTGTQLTDRLMVTYAGIDLQGRLYVNTSGERLPFRGGIWAVGSAAGLGALALSAARSTTSTYVGARPVFVNP